MVRLETPNHCVLCAMLRSPIQPLFDPACRQGGFSLVQISVLIAISGILLASILPGGNFGSDVEKKRITQERMEKIEQATRAFMTANLRRPCPSDIVLAPSNANFGQEAANAGRCQGGTPAATYSESAPVVITGTLTTDSQTVSGMLNLTDVFPGMLVSGTNISPDTHVLSVDSSTSITLDKVATGSGATSLTFNSIAAGGVPTKTLGISDEYMFDGYGRRMTYMVDIAATDPTTCRDKQISNEPGSITLMNANTVVDNTMWALVSHGKDGHGAIAMEGGGTFQDRINAGITDSDTQTNAFVAPDNDFSLAPTVSRTLIRKEQTTGFDDLVWASSSTKNTCCIGRACNLGTRISGAETGALLGTQVATGDINGDGILDTIFSTPNYNKIHVLFGRKSGWPNPDGKSATTTDILNLATNNNSRFITITNDDGVANFAGYVAAGNINGDNYDDIAISTGGNGAAAKITVFLGSANPANTNFSSLSDVITYPSTAESARQFVLADIDANGRKDIITLFSSSTAYVRFGKDGASGAQTILISETSNTLQSTEGFKITNGGSVTMTAIMGTGNFDNRHAGDEFIIRGGSGTNTLYTIFSRNNWSATVNSGGGSAPDFTDILSQTSSHTVGTRISGSSDVGSSVIMFANVNSDAMADLIVNSGDYISIYYGKAASWSETINLNTGSSYDGGNGFRIETASNLPSWVSTIRGTLPVVTDINNDGRNDIIFNDPTASPNGLAGAGSVFVMLQPSSGWSGFGSNFMFFNTAGGVFVGSDSGDAGMPLNNDTSRGFRIDGSTASSSIAVRAAADINSDGRPDLIVPAPSLLSNAGIAYVFFGRRFVAWERTESVAPLN
jgi:type II secretory pathway pseudopilin PulG